MIYLEFFLAGVSLSMDAFAVSVCKGLGMTKINKKQMFVIALFFGGFQALMPFVGWLLGNRFEKYITSFDHWIAFALLVFIGGKMLFDALKKDDEAKDENEKDSPLDLKELTVMAVATSIDALAVGIVYGLEAKPIVPAITIIGLVTFAICIFGVVIGNLFGSKYEKGASVAGGIILILLGTKILLEGLGVLSFGI